MAILKVFIIEDEVPAQLLLEKWIEQIPELELSGIFSDGFSALKAIQANAPDLIFLDIEMPKINGLEMLELIDNPPQVIFTTAYHEYAVNAFELAAVDYLLKPFSFDRFKQSIFKAIAQKEHSILNLRNAVFALRKGQMNPVLDRIVVKDGINIHIIPISEIFFLEAQDDYVMIHTKENKYLKLIGLQTLEKQLPARSFVRVHRSYIVNIAEISKIQNINKDSWGVFLSNGKFVKISRSGLTLLREIMYI
jgi:two-component system LytT family response regulator